MPGRARLDQEAARRESGIREPTPTTELAMSYQLIEFSVEAGVADPSHSTGRNGATP